MLDLLEWTAPEPEAVTWKPRIVGKEQWPPDYRAVYAWRLRQLDVLRSSPEMLASAKAYYANPAHAAEFIMHWMDTYDPRKIGDDVKWMPFVLFQRQGEFLEFLNELYADRENGLVEKCRDVGLTWLCVAWSVWAWLYMPGIAVGWGSRSQVLVDVIGVPDSIFEKIRLLIRRLPREFLPDGFSQKEHLMSMRVINPENGATIAGEIGDNIGRGGRKSIYFKDESAHYEHPDLIEASLGDNTDVQLDISSVNGLGNVFHRRRDAGVDWRPGEKIEKGKTRVFVVDWRDHPAKTQEWYDRRRARMESEGLLHIFKQEVDRDYSGSIEGTIIPYEWIEAAQDAHIKLGFEDWGQWIGAYDPADEGGDTNACGARKGVVLRRMEQWGGRDVGKSTRHAIELLGGIAKAFNAPFGTMRVEYDPIGIGAGAKAEYNRLVETDNAEETQLKELTALLGFNPWNAGGAVQWPFRRVIPDDPETPLNKDFYRNVKAQAWWELRLRFWRTYQAITLGMKFDPDTLISLDSTLPLIREIKKELAQPTRDKDVNLKMIVDKKPDGTKSPNLADAIVMMYFPITDQIAVPLFGRQGN